MRIIDQLKNQRAEVWDKMEAITKPADAAGRDLKPDELTAYDALEAEFKGFTNSIEHAERREANAAAANAVTAGRTTDAPSAPMMGHVPDDGKPKAARSLGEHFAREAGERLQNSAAGGSRFSIGSSEFRNAATDTVVTGGPDGDMTLVLTQVDTTIVEAPRRRLVVEDLLDSGVMTAQALTYFVEGAFEGDFTTVAENAPKPQMNVLPPSIKTDALTKIAGWIRESDEMITDLPFLVTAINNRLLYRLALFTENQVLNGNGVGTNLLGLLNRSGVQLLGAGTDAAGDNPDKLFQAITDVSTVSGFDADGIMINPADYQKLRLKKDANEQYYGGGFFAGQYGNGAVVEQLPIWGKRTVVTPAIAAGTALVGAFGVAATVYSKGGVRVEATNSHEDDFTNNRVTIRAEHRKALAARVPAAMVKVTLGTV